MRQLVPLALLGLALLPDWAAAFGHRRVCLPPPPPVYCPPPVVFVVPYAPVAPAAPPNYSILPAPTVRQEPPAPAPSEPAPAPPKPVTPGVPPGDGRGAADPFNPGGFARPESADPRPAPKGGSPKDGGPKIDAPQIPLPGAGAGAPKEDDAKLPPLIPRLPNPDVPPLTIPQLPVGPDTSTSKASPLTGSAGPRVEVFPVAGPPPDVPAARRTVGFFNHTDRDVKLTVEGKTVTLPKRHHVTAEVPARFVWQLDGGEERRTVVPAAAPGVEVVIRK
jgi:hypothetical protein